MIQELLMLISSSNLERSRHLGFHVLVWSLFNVQIMGNNKFVAIKEPCKQYCTESFQRDIKGSHIKHRPGLKIPLGKKSVTPRAL